MVIYPHYELTGLALYSIRRDLAFLVMTRLFHMTIIGSERIQTAIQITQYQGVKTEEHYLILTDWPIELD